MTVKTIDEVPQKALFKVQTFCEDETGLRDRDTSYCYSKSLTCDQF